MRKSLRRIAAGVLESLAMFALALGLLDVAHAVLLVYFPDRHDDCMCVAPGCKKCGLACECHDP